MMTDDEGYLMETEMLRLKQRVSALEAELEAMRLRLELLCARDVIDLPNEGGGEET